MRRGVRSHSQRTQWKDRQLKLRLEQGEWFIGWPYQPVGAREHRWVSLSLSLRRQVPLGDGATAFQCCFGRSPAAEASPADFAAPTCAVRGLTALKECSESDAGYGQLLVTLLGRKRYDDSNRD
eukprot:5721703-Amphidinium_carterae.1